MANRVLPSPCLALPFLVTLGCGSVEPGPDAETDVPLVFDVVLARDVPPAMDAGSSTALPDAGPPDAGTIADAPDARFVFDVQVVPDKPVVATDGGTGTCEITPAVAAHVRAMETQGWASRNRARTLAMHGCAGAASPRECLRDTPLASAQAFGAQWDPSNVNGARLRLLFTSNYRSSFWTRSSADGRFIGHGNRIVDLAGTARAITTAAQFDPGFFPDNSGFFYHSMIGPRVCLQSLLTTTMVSNVTLMEPQCARAGGIGLYQHLGVSLQGDDYLVVYGRYSSDDGGHAPTLRDPPANFGAGERISVTALTNTGTTFNTGSTGAVTTPMEADPIISPSSQLLMNRLAGPGGGQTAFVLRRLEVNRNGSAVTVTAPVIARYCFSGGKGSISFDERWFTYHHYVTDADAVEMGFSGPDDPGFAPYRTRGAANSYLVDLRTGTRTRITNMQPGQYALFPHFRSDGWIYLVVRTAGQTPEHLVATDAALLAN